MRLRRLLLLAAVTVAPFAAAVTTAGPAQATCDPRKPSTCGCPVGWKAITVAGRTICLPDRIES